MPCSCHLCNISLDDETGESPYYKRHGVHLEGNAIPFGCGVCYKPNNVSEQPSKMDPRLVYGVFVGCKVGPGGEEVDQYLVCNIEDFIGKKLHHETSGKDIRYISPNVITVIEFDSERGVHFPCNAACERANCTLAGRSEGANSKIDPLFQWEVERFPLRPCQYQRKLSLVLVRAARLPSQRPALTLSLNLLS
jgi:hypothetical protein